MRNTVTLFFILSVLFYWSWVVQFAVNIYYFVLLSAKKWCFSRVTSLM